MNVATAIYRNGRLELTSPVDWPEGTPVEVKPVRSRRQRPSWLSLPPLDVGCFQELTGDDDLLGEMLDDSRS
ncbi:MAG TPA: antitoxin family protein [Pirellulaceae bacterium]|nr:antitoxin family protein [Pirellulaceae bacterium]